MQNTWFQIILKPHCALICDVIMGFTCLQVSTIIHIVVHALTFVQLLGTPWKGAHQAPLSPTISWRSLILVSIESSSAPSFSSCFQSSPASGSFPISQLFASGGQNIGTSILATVLPMNIEEFVETHRCMHLELAPCVQFCVIFSLCHYSRALFLIKLLKG